MLVPLIANGSFGPLCLVRERREELLNQVVPQLVVFVQFLVEHRLQIQQTVHAPLFVLQGIPM
jgi:hypothetical protein